ncbi:hypothetical protein BC830DRAFT_904387 [Chytriomyces sp. MP71]|nr:hypothetical protein BC830DRAFT_904387 [Chytriomyces sp. MP71]
MTNASVSLANFRNEASATPKPTSIPNLTIIIILMASACIVLSTIVGVLIVRRRETRTEFHGDACSSRVSRPIADAVGSGGTPLDSVAPLDRVHRTTKHSRVVRLDLGGAFALLMEVSSCKEEEEKKEDVWGSRGMRDSVWRWSGILERHGVEPPLPLFIEQRKSVSKWEKVWLWMWPGRRRVEIWGASWHLLPCLLRIIQL